MSRFAITDYERTEARDVITDIVKRTIRRKKKRDMTAEEQAWCADKKKRLIAEISKRGGPSLDDWWVECERRESGKSQGSIDFYYFAPGRTKRFRSVAEVARSLALEPDASKRTIPKKTKAAPPPLVA